MQKSVKSTETQKAADAAKNKKVAAKEVSTCLLDFVHVPSCPCPIVYVALALCTHASLSPSESRPLSLCLRLPVTAMLDTFLDVDPCFALQAKKAQDAELAALFNEALAGGPKKVQEWHEVPPLFAV